MRQFNLTTAKRESVPLLIGLTGASGSGKTYSALRLATGISKVVGKPIHVIDTESRRALHYADSFDFQHLQFDAPFSPLDYLAAIKHCVSNGAGVVVVDSMSHEHEGPGGVLDMHDQAVQKRSGGDWKKAQAVQFACWAEPKAQRQRLINEILQLGINAIFCFRAKEKLRMPTPEEKRNGQKEPVQLGWMPIAGDNFIYEMTANCLLYPGCKGVPEWSPSQPGERLISKLPSQFASVLTPNTQLSEDLGEQMARWSSGDSKPAAPINDRIDSADIDGLRAIVAELDSRKQQKTIQPAEYKSLRAKAIERGKQLKSQEETPMREPGED